MNGLDRWWADEPARSALEQEPSRERARMSVGTSFAVHVVVLALLLATEFGRAERPAPLEPDFPLLIAEPEPPPAPRNEVPVVIPKALRQDPVPPRAAPEAPLLGWKTQGDEPGQALRPPGPEQDVHRPEQPGESGEGTKDADNARPERAADVPEPAGNTTPASPGGPERMNDAAGGAPRPPSGPQAEPGGDRRTPSMRVPPITGREPGRPGRGRDFALGKGGSYFGDVHFESGDYNWSDYSTKVYFAVYRAWLRELLGRSTRFERDQLRYRLPDLDGEVRIQFTILRSGAVDDLQVVQPSVLPTLDEASSAALRRAVLPALPEDFPRDAERVTFGFRISGFESSHQLRLRLEMDQAAGEF